MKGSLKWDTEGEEDVGGMILCSGRNVGKTDLGLFGVMTLRLVAEAIYGRRVESRLITGSSAGMIIGELAINPRQNFQELSKHEKNDIITPIPSLPYELN